MAVRCRAACMNDTFWDAFMVKMLNFLAQDKIFQKCRRL
jgi:hypothetical protein